ncbi:PREDICTED: bromodomain testis-specific protein [Drosophila arizonae]|uniref:Bromodomain testis-specific protein n=1 Tax=Drosophila arizonae TaxID=7263 RepID=A0ABM1NRL7_DROAR|nr:PREDICTED: bromodomain testis-specific protein [Drosophila arizonae]
MYKLGKGKMKPKQAKPSIEEIPPRIEPCVLPVNGVVQPPVIPPPERPGRLTNVLESLKSVLESLWRSRWSSYFKKPVDASKLCIPDYHTVIKHPMDLSTIRQRLNNNYYWRANEALEDFELIFANSSLFFMPGSRVHAAGKQLSAIYRTCLSMIDMSNETQLNTKSLLRRRKVRPLQLERAYPVPSKLPRLDDGACQTQEGDDSESDSDVDDEPDGEPVEFDSTPDILIDWQIYLVEKNHSLRMLQCLTKRKRDHINWPFRSGDLWRQYSQNLHYNHDVEDKLDWETLRFMLDNDEIQNFEHLIERLRTMFQNALACFPMDENVIEATTALNAVLESHLGAFRSSLTEAKKRIQYLASKKLRDYNIILSQQDSYHSSEERFSYGAGSYQQYR